MSSSTLVIPLPQLIRIRSTGTDRVKFLHNFCTNDINGLVVGTSCEAFFTNVKARILAHGFILAGEDHHEIWMLPGDEDLLLSHLNRYIITEDACFESLTAGLAAMAVIGRLPVSLAHDGQRESGSWTDDAAVRCLSLHWAGQSLSLFSGPDPNIRSLQASILERGELGTSSDFERLRIRERFPLIGTDLNDDHLAPEAARDVSAICYTKGCYLGQEPIARIDAMGRINRALASVELQGESTDSVRAGQLSSFDETQSPTIGLAVVPADNIGSGETIVRTADGVVFSANIFAPRSLNGD